MTKNSPLMRGAGGERVRVIPRVLLNEPASFKGSLSDVGTAIDALLDAADL